MKNLMKASKLPLVVGLLLLLASCGKEDLTPPIISLDGDAQVTIVLGGTFTDPGYTATDEEDGDLTGNVLVDGTVDVDAIGKYTITYSVTDAAGNTDQTTREVWVVADKDTYAGNFSVDGLITTTDPDTDNDYITMISASGTTDGLIFIDNLGDYEFWGTDAPYTVNTTLTGDLNNEVSIAHTVTASGRTYTGTGTLSSDGNTLTLTFGVNDGTLTIDHQEVFTRM